MGLGQVEQGLSSLFAKFLAYNLMIFESFSVLKIHFYMALPEPKTGYPIRHYFSYENQFYLKTILFIWQNLTEYLI